MSTEIALSFNMEKTLSGTSGGRSFNRLKPPKNGSVVVRILPPFGTNHGGGLYAKYTVHWGFHDAEQNPRPVACSYPTERFCPVCDMVKAAKADMEALKKEGQEDSKRYKDLSKTVETYDSKTFFLFNVIDLADGEVKILEIPKTAVSGKGKELSPNSLMGKIKEAIEKRKFDPISLSTGVWFEVSRTGDGINTVYSVDFNRIIKTVDGEEVESLNRSPIEESTLKKIQAQMGGEQGPLYDIHTFYETRTSSQLKSFLDGNPVPAKPKNNTVAASTEEVAEEPGDVPQVSYNTSVEDGETKTNTKAAASSESTPSRTSATSATTQSPKPAGGNIQSEIQKLRERAKLREQGK